MLGHGAADVGSQEGNHGGEVGTGVHGKPGEAADQGLISFAVTDKCRVLLTDCCGLDDVDGAPRAVWCGERIEVDVRKTVGLDNVLGVHLLGKVDRKRTARVG